MEMANAAEAKCGGSVSPKDGAGVNSEPRGSGQNSIQHERHPAQECAGRELLDCRLGCRSGRNHQAYAGVELAGASQWKFDATMRAGRRTRLDSDSRANAIGS